MYDVLGNNCKRSPQGYEFLGIVNQSTWGKSCLSWSEFSDIILPDVDEMDAGNSCRMARSHTLLDIQYDQPWCFTVDGPEPCEVPYCGKRKNIYMQFFIFYRMCRTGSGLSIREYVSSLR